MNNTLQKIIAAYEGLFAALNELQHQAHHNHPVMLSAADVRSIITLFNTALDSVAGSVASLAALQTELTALKADITDLNDPALSADLTAVLAKAHAATVSPVVDPLPEATNPDGSLVKDNVTNPDGTVTTSLGNVLPAPVGAP